MKDYSLYIILTYGVSALGLCLMAFQSFRAMKKARAQADALRRKRKGS